MSNIHRDTRAALLRAESVYRLELPDGPLRVRCGGVEQRNWSRVAEAVALDRESTIHSGKLFLKQHVGRTGGWHAHLCEYEQQGVRVARELLQDIINVPDVIGADPGRLVIVFEHYEIVSTDILLRQSPEAFYRAFPIALAKMERVLDATLHRRVSDPAVSIKEKKRPYGGLGNAINFKGLDFRNVGFLMHPNRVLTEDDVVMFDVGRPYYAPVEEAAAKLIVSIGLMNWGSPLARFIKGPDKQLLRTAADMLQPYLDAQAIRAEVSLQSTFRMQEVHAPDKFRRTLKGIGNATIGRDYLRKLGNCFDAYFDDRGRVFSLESRNH